MKVQILSINNISLLIKCGYYKWSIKISTFISTIYLKIQIRNPSRNIGRYILRVGTFSSITSPKDILRNEEQEYSRKLSNRKRSCIETKTSNRNIHLMYVN
jgi:hypothetical protein